MLTARATASRLGIKVESVYAYVSRGVLTRYPSPTGRESRFDQFEVERLAQRGRPRLSSNNGVVTIVVETRLTSVIDGVLRYRGVEATALARNTRFEDVAELLWLATEPPSSPPGQTWPPTGRSATNCQTARQAIRQSLEVTTHHQTPPFHPASVAAAGRHMITAMVESLPLVGPDGESRSRGSSASHRGPSSTIARRLWPRLTSRRPRTRLVGALNAALVLLADHELASSTLAARVVASTRADPYAVVAAGLAALSGPYHGGASAKVRSIFDAAAKFGPESAIKDAWSEHNGRLPGFGHPLYPHGDPRTLTVLALLRAAPSSRVTLIDETLRCGERIAGSAPNIDAGLAALGLATHMTADAGETVFAIARTAGWLAHAIEEYDEPPLRFRPRANYVGPVPTRASRCESER